MCNEFIDSKDISIVFQGQIEYSDETTKRAIESIRNIFPDSPIILSTWEGSNVSGLDYDVLVLNTDPGAEFFDIPPNAKKSKKHRDCVEFKMYGRKFIVKGKKNNVNRMLLTTKKGLEKVETEYVLKLRTDVILQNNDFLEYWNKFEKYNERYRLFKHRIINNALYAQFAHVMGKNIQLLPFHISDWVFFGYTEDVKLLFSCPFQSSESAYNYWDGSSRRRLKFEPFRNARWQYPPESYILYSLAHQKFNNIQFEHSDDYNETNMQQSNHIISNNFIMLDQDQLCFKMDKYPSQFKWERHFYDGFITHQHWQYLYKKYCDHDYKFVDFNHKRFKIIAKTFFNFKSFLRNPKRHLDKLTSLKSQFSQRRLRRKFFIKGDNNSY